MKCFKNVGGHFRDHQLITWVSGEVWGKASARVWD